MYCELTLIIIRIIYSRQSSCDRDYRRSFALTCRRVWLAFPPWELLHSCLCIDSFRTISPPAEQDLDVLVRLGEEKRMQIYTQPSRPSSILLHYSPVHGRLQSPVAVGVFSRAVLVLGEFVGFLIARRKH